jgi:hypothetical protein
VYLEILDFLTGFLEFVPSILSVWKDISYGFQRSILKHFKTRFDSHYEQKPKTLPSLKIK